MHDISDLERRGLPGVFVATVEFTSGAQAQARSLGFDAAGVFTPHPIQDRTDDEMRAIARQVYPDIVAAITSS